MRWAASILRALRAIPASAAGRMLVAVSFAVTVAACVAAVTACESAKPASEVRLWTDSYAVRITSSPSPPISEEMTTFTIVVQDKATGQPIDGGAGRIFGSTRDLAQASNGLAKGAAVGTYTATVRFPTAGDWAMGLQFRRDSAAKLERTNDWVQTVSSPPPLGQAPPKQ